MTRIKTGNKVVNNPYMKKKEADCGCKKKKELTTISSNQSKRDSTN